MLKWLQKKLAKKSVQTDSIAPDTAEQNPKNTDLPAEQHIQTAPPADCQDVSVTDTLVTDMPLSAESTTAPKKTPVEKSWTVRLFTGLTKSSSKISDNISGVFTKRKLDNEALQDLSDILIMSDMGVSLSERFSQNIAKTRFNKNVSDVEIKTAVADQVQAVLDPVCIPLKLGDNKPHVIMVVGVNGSGKTTTIGKLAKRYMDMGKSVLLGAGDTFRAAAVEQLQVWANRSGADIVCKDAGADAGALAYETISKGLNDNTDVILLDTAGRLHNKQHLMDELQKVQRVIQKLIPDAPHDTVIVLDGTVGQNAIEQIQHFKECVAVSGIIMTKLDGTAKGGVLVQIADTYKIPIHAVGVGETIDDLNAFAADTFAYALMGLQK